MYICKFISIFYYNDPCEVNKMVSLM